MRTKLMLAAVLAAALVGCGEINGNGHIVEQARPVGAFSGVSFAEGLHGDIVVGPEASVKIRGDSNLLDYIELELRGGILTSRLDTGLGLMPSEPIVVTVVTPTLTELRASSATRLRASGLQAERFTLVASVSAEVSLSGSARELALRASGGSGIEARALAVEVASVDVSGGSDVTVHVSQEISGSVSGGSDLTVQGRPLLNNLHTSGGSQVHVE